MYIVLLIIVNTPVVRYFLIFLLLVLQQSVCSAQAYKIDTIQYVGESEDYYDLIIMAEGYRDSDLELFRSDARKVKDIMMLSNAYEPQMDRLNIFSISTPSVDKGLSLIAENPHPDDPIQSTSLKNTFFNIYFRNSYRAFFLDETTILKARHFAAEHVPFSESVLILTNDEIGSGRASFSGVAAATRPDGAYPGSGAYVINHELAHSIAGLSDAYSTTPEEGLKATPCLSK